MFFSATSLEVDVIAPTDPSPPNPQLITDLVPSGAVLNPNYLTSKEVCVTSSVIPTVKWFLGFS